MPQSFERPEHPRNRQRHTCPCCQPYPCTPTPVAILVRQTFRQKQWHEQTSSPSMPSVWIPATLPRRETGSLEIVISSRGGARHQGPVAPPLSDGSKQQQYPLLPCADSAAHPADQCSGKDSAPSAPHFGNSQSGRCRHSTSLPDSLSRPNIPRGCRVRLPYVPRVIRGVGQ